MHTYLTKTDRIIIEHEKRQELSGRAIARKMNKPHSTIANELKKQKGYRYMAGDAQQITDANLKKRGAKSTAEKHIDLIDSINENYDKKDMPLKKLVQQWKKSYPEDTPSLSTIYNWLPKGVFDINYNDILRPRKKRKQTTNTWKRMVGTPITNRIEDFPNFKEEFGHWEADLIVGSTTNKGYVLTLLEKKSRFAITKLLTSKDADYVLENLKQRIEENGKYPFKSITFDNGLEFTKTQKLEEQGIKIYYAFPYCSWQRGQNENWNGFLRRWFPKGTNFLKVTPEELAEATSRINHFERDILNEKSAQEVLDNYVKINS